MVVTFDRTGLAVTYLDGVPISSTSIAGDGDIDQPEQCLQHRSGRHRHLSLVWHRPGPRPRRRLTTWASGAGRSLPTEAESIYIVGQNYGRSFDTYGPVELTLQPSGTGFDLIWQAGTLLECDTVNGTYVPVSGASAPYYHVTPAAVRKFYRVRL